MLRRYVDFYSKLKFFKVCDFIINELIWKETLAKLKILIDLFAL